MITKEEILKALEKHWNIGPAATSLGIGYSTLRKYIKEYGIAHDSRKSRDGATFDRKAWAAGRVTAARQNKKLKLLEYLGGMKCQRCGFDVPIADCYAFHHKNPVEKDPDWSKMKSNNWSFEKMKSEMDKCEVLCHNCHSIVHYEIRNSPVAQR